MKNVEPILAEAARKELLAHARAALVSYLSAGRIPDCEKVHPDLRRQCGAFVSLHAGEELRGCIGMLSPERDLLRTVQHCAISAALEDFRFPSVTADEIPRLRIEISVLTPMKRIGDVSVIEVGKHGLMISRGGFRGLLLPQVGGRYGWERETFLAQTCRKAGLPESAWRQSGTAIYIFEAQVFSEPEEAAAQEG